MLRTILAAGLMLAATAGAAFADPPGADASGAGRLPPGGPAHQSTPAPDGPPEPRLVCSAGPRTCPAPARADPGDRCSCGGGQGGHALQGQVVPQPSPRH